MKEEQDLKDQFLESNKKLIELFDELHNSYDLLKSENESLKSKAAESSLEINTKFGIVNLAKLNGEAIFDAINHFNKSCPYCKIDLYAGHIRNNYEIDHFFPIAKGGQDVPWNLLPICKKCNRKKRDKLPFEYLDESTYNECNKYLESVLLKITNSHEDKLQRDEIIHSLLMNLSSNKHTIDEFISKLHMLFNIPLRTIRNDVSDLSGIRNQILLNKEHLFGAGSGTYTTEKKVADLLFKKKPTLEQKNLVKKLMRDMFQDCRLKSNTSYYSIKECIDKLNTLEHLSDLNMNAKQDLSD